MVSAADWRNPAPAAGSTKLAPARAAVTLVLPGQKKPATSAKRSAKQSKSAAAKRLRASRGKSAKRATKRAKTKRAKHKRRYAKRRH